MSKSPITCHVLDSSTGKPAEGVEVSLQGCYSVENSVDMFQPMAKGVTNSDGRCTDLLPPRGASDAIELQKGGTYKVIFKTKDYFAKTDRKCFYPWVEIIFELENPEDHYHIPLLISPYSFTTYRGS
ncbi:transthyretin [Athelia psychrophila]|uniref:5-hydroxyisourate hydrolase n=1 Tax=Athelia psychrophila TaxID=1759441 RepID=A0A166UIV5_9AGAM|nr:transthyretin [Fibularhizoctonia sp. CBS 109695]